MYKSILAHIVCSKSFEDSSDGAKIIEFRYITCQTPVMYSSGMTNACRCILLKGYLEIRYAQINHNRIYAIVFKLVSVEPVK